jgi:hypothetical protein
MDRDVLMPPDACPEPRRNGAFSGVVPPSVGRVGASAGRTVDRRPRVGVPRRVSAAGRHRRGEEEAPGSGETKGPTLVGELHRGTVGACPEPRREGGVSCGVGPRGGHRLRPDGSHSFAAQDMVQEPHPPSPTPRNEMGYRPRRSPDEPRSHPRGRPMGAVPSRLRARLAKPKNRLMPKSVARPVGNAVWPRFLDSRPRPRYRTPRNARGCSSVVERHVANVRAVGSNPGRTKELRRRPSHLALLLSGRR